MSVGLAPHSIRAVTRDWLRAFSVYDGPLHMHVSEQPAENHAAHSEYGCSPTAVIESEGLLSESFTAVHMTHQWRVIYIAYAAQVLESVSAQPLNWIWVMA